MAEETPDEKLSETLESLSERLRESNEQEMKTMQGRKKDQSHLTLKTIAKAVLDIRQIMVLQALNERRDIGGAQEQEVPEEENKSDAPKLESVGLNFFEIAAALTGAVAGLVAGLVAGIGKFFGSIAKLLLKEETILKITQSWTKVTTNVAKFFKSIGTFVQESIASVKKLFTVSAEESVFVKSAKTFFSSIGKLFEGIIAPVKAAFAPLTSAGKIAKDMTKIFKSFFSFFKPIGELFGKFFAPIYIGIELIVDAFKIFSDETTTLSEKFTTFLFDIPKVIGNFFLEIPEMIKKGISWLFEKLVGPDNPITKFLDSFSFTEMWGNAIDGLQKLFTSPKETFTKMVDYIDEAIAGAIKWFDNFDLDKMIDDALNGLWDFGAKMAASIGESIDNAIQWTKDLIAKYDPIGAISEWWNNFKEDPVGGIVGLLMTPINLIKGAVDWIIDQFTFDKTKDAAEEADGGNLFKNILKILMLPTYLAIKTIDFVLGKLGFDELQSYIANPVDALKQFGDWISGLLDQAIAWLKDKLSFFGGDSEKKQQKEMQKMAEERGIVKKEGGTFGFGKKSTIDQDTLQNMTDNQLGELTKAYADDKDLFPVLQAEAERRKMERKKPGTLQSAIQPPQSVVEVEAAYATPAVITGLGQESVAQSDDLMVTQQQLDTNRQQATAPLAAAGNGSVGIDASSSSVTNVTNYIPAKQPSSRDQTDQMYIFRATGTPR